MSKAKGSRAERYFCKLIRSFDPKWDARRAQQYSGVKIDDSSADIIHNLPYIRFECKKGYGRQHHTTKRFKKWIKTAKQETSKDHQWAILYRPDYYPPTITVELNTILWQSQQIKKVIKLLERLSFKKHNINPKQWHYDPVRTSQ